MTICKNIPIFFLFRSDNIRKIYRDFILCVVGANVYAYTVYPKKYAHGFCFAVLCCGYTLTDFPIPIRLTSLALWQSDDCPSARKATLMNMDKYFMWINYERLYNHYKAKHNKTVCIFLGIYCMCILMSSMYTYSCLYRYTFICAIVLLNNELFNWILYSTNETEMHPHALAK